MVPVKREYPQSFSSPVMKAQQAVIEERQSSCEWLATTVSGTISRWLNSFFPLQIPLWRRNLSLETQEEFEAITRIYRDRLVCQVNAGSSEGSDIKILKEWADKIYVRSGYRSEYTEDDERGGRGHLRAVVLEISKGEKVIDSFLQEKLPDFVATGSNTIEIFSHNVKVKECSVMAQLNYLSQLTKRQ